MRTAGLDQYSLGCSVVINGGPATRTLGSLTVDEVESVEIYGAEIFKVNPAAEANYARLKAAALGRPAGGGSKKAALPPRPRETDAVVSRVPITNAGNAQFDNQGVAMKCPKEAIYVWLR